MRTGSQRGIALPAVMLLALAVVAAVATMSLPARELALDLSARHDVLCARYGALSALEVAELLGDLVVARARTLELGLAGLDDIGLRAEASPSQGCVLIAEAVCGKARRSAVRQLGSVGDCVMFGAVVGSSVPLPNATIRLAIL